MLAYIRESMRKAIIAAVHLWLSDHYCNEQQLPGCATSFIYPEDIGWGSDVLRGQRIRVTFTLEKWPV